jgi:hypothetical protein
LIERVRAPGKRRPLAAGWQLVNAAGADGRQLLGGWRRYAPSPDLVKEQPMRAVLLILIVAVLVILAGLFTGFIDVNQIRGAKAPVVSATSNGVVAKGGQTPAFDVQTGSVEVGSRNATVKMPALEVKPPPEANGAAPANQVNAM